MNDLMQYVVNNPGQFASGLTFYAFASVLLFAGLMVITARNPVHSVLFLILSFFNAAGLFLLMGAEFLAALLVIVYVGAVAVLFLFVVMMLDIDFKELRRGMASHLPIGLVVAGMLTAEIVMLALSWSFAPGATVSVASEVPAGVGNTEAIGQILYTQYLLPFQVAGLVLLVAMIGAIVLTHRERAGVRRQKISAQVSRKPSDVVQLRHVESGEGV